MRRTLAGISRAYGKEQSQGKARKQRFHVSSIQTKTARKAYLSTMIGAMSRTPAPPPRGTFARACFPPVYALFRPENVHFRTVFCGAATPKIRKISPAQKLIRVLLYLAPANFRCKNQPGSHSATAMRHIYRKRTDTTPTSRLSFGEMPETPARVRTVAPIRCIDNRE